MPTDPDGRTHHAECWRDHLDCARREIERLRTVVEAARVVAERTTGMNGVGYRMRLLDALDALDAHRKP